NVHVLRASRSSSPSCNSVRAREDEWDPLLRQRRQNHVKIDGSRGHAISPVRLILPLQKENFLDGLVVPEIARRGLHGLPGGVGRDDGCRSDTWLGLHAACWPRRQTEMEAALTIVPPI